MIVGIQHPTPKISHVYVVRCSRSEVVFLISSQTMRREWKLCLYRVYALRDPRIKGHIPSIRYIGRTEARLSERLRTHLSHAKDLKRKTPYFEWIRELVRLGFAPIIEELANVPERQASLRLELKTIREYRVKGAPLFNHLPLK